MAAGKLQNPNKIENLGTDVVAGKMSDYAAITGRAEQAASSAAPAATDPDSHDFSGKGDEGEVAVDETADAHNYGEERVELLKQMGAARREELATDFEPMRQGNFAFGGLFNFRDLALADPGRIRPGRVFRSATPSEAVADDVLILLNSFCVKTIVDFREKSEALLDPGEKLLLQHYPSDDEQDDDHGMEYGGIGSDAATAAAASTEVSRSRRLVRAPYIPVGVAARSPPQLSLRCCSWKEKLEGRRGDKQWIIWDLLSCSFAS